MLITAAEVQRRIRAMLEGRHVAGPLRPQDRQKWLLGQARKRPSSSEESGSGEGEGTLRASDLILGKKRE